ncbi:MAG: carboxy terminal-processing peptidase [Chitinispirillia bacterium]|jgi:carboxyl-terminal processing protease
MLKFANKMTLTIGLMLWNFLFIHYALGDQVKDRILPPLIIQNLKNSHFAPREINDKFSEDLFNNYLKNLDFEKKFFLKSDIDSLKKFYHLLDDQLILGKNEFYLQVKAILKKRINESRKYFTQALLKPFDFTIKDSIVIDLENTEYAKDTVELKTRWRKLLKYKTLAKYADLIEEKKKDTTATKKEKPKSLAELEIEAREKEKKSNDTWFKRTVQLTEIDHLSLFINSMTSLYDPHTNYFPPQQKENFDITMTGQLEGIGARLQEKDGFIKVVDIVPGSASYRQGELQSGDKILAVAEGDNEPVDVVNVSLNEAVKLIRGPKGTEVRLTVEKVNGLKKIIPIIRDIVIIEETYAKSARLMFDESDLNIGYIKLPKFYADFNRQGARSCAKDVEQEIKKLKTENIQGLILDLRNNSGGSLRDVVEMAGLFIKTGGIVQVKANKNVPRILKDHDPRVQYGGPLVILINQFSASASEILAAAIQDYNRGVIIGTCMSSYGKGTVQTFFDLNRYAQSPYVKAKDLGALKVTTQKFYRINGGATQKKGVIPDISLPDVFMYLDMGEKEHDYVMEWDKIQPLIYDTYANNYDIEKIRKLSQDRVSQNEIFKLVKTRGIEVKEANNKKYFTLVYKEKMQELKKAEKENKLIEDKKEQLKGLHAKNLKADLKNLGTDSVKIEINRKWIEEIEKDVYLHEVFKIISDMI